VPRILSKDSKRISPSSATTDGVKFAKKKQAMLTDGIVIFIITFIGGLGTFCKNDIMDDMMGVQEKIFVLFVVVLGRGQRIWYVACAWRLFIVRQAQVSSERRTDQPSGNNFSVLLSVEGISEGDATIRRSQRTPLNRWSRRKLPKN
jgi:hypothetical protein